MVLNSELPTTEVQTGPTKPSASEKKKKTYYLGGESEAIEDIQASMYGMAELWQIIYLASHPDQR